MVNGRGINDGGSTAVIAMLSAATGTFAMLLSVVGPALPVMQAKLQTDQLGASWIMTAYLLSAAVLTPVMGRLGDSWGKKQVLIGVLLLCALGCVVSAWSVNLWMMLAGRVIQGVGGGAFPLAFGIIRDHLEGRRLNRAVGVVSGFGAACVGLGSVLSGFVIVAVGFRWLFWGPAIVLLLAVIVVGRLPNSPRTKASLNVFSVALFAIGLSSLLLVVNQVAIWGITSLRSIIVASVALGGLAVWILVDRKARGPLIDMRIFRMNVMWTTSISAALLGMAVFGLQTFVPQFVQTDVATGYGLGLSVLESGLVMLPMATGMFLTGFSSARIIDLVGVRRVLTMAPSLAAVGALFLVPNPAELWQVLIASGLMGLGIGLTFSVMSAVVVSGVPANQSGIASGINANLRTVGGAIGTALVAAIVAPTMSGGQPSAQDYSVGFLTIAVAAALAAVVGLFTKTPMSTS